MKTTPLACDMNVFTLTGPEGTRKFLHEEFSEAFA